VNREKKSGSKKTIEKLVKKYPIKLVGETKDYCLLEICSDRHQEDEILKLLKKIGIQELVRTGRIAIGK